MTFWEWQLMSWSISRLMIACIFLLSFYYLIIFGRSLFDKKYFKHRFIIRNDERNLLIQDKCFRNVGLMAFAIAGAAYGWMMGAVLVGVEPNVQLLPLSLALFLLVFGTYLLSYWFFSKKL
ncbi:hypothetical protein [Streptococcus loxodontisalivarius]|uniref:DUF3784 domain-containing protein n=1 Tax=Streptococcus loxodontisalivarius TaxID=1349415 RepID=A0ABS2PU39_9STRE|nr:hypothetical protein [Streptococcus loxodontisalivarius]MBM7643562.1 hypothetical protein [Streptococcus loxodontisalivarius]